MTQVETRSVGRASGLVVVWGLLGRYPYGGVTWQALHHIDGLRRLGLDVWYVEDSHSKLFSPTTHSATMEYAENVEFVRRWMDWLGMSDRWIFRPPGTTDELVGATEADLARLYRAADAVFNVCGAQEVREEHAGIRHLVYVQTDPVEEQVRVALGDADLVEHLDAHDAHFTYGENLGADDCLVPIARYDWRPTRPPVVLDWWDGSGTVPREVITTVANWKHDGKDVVWNGHCWHWSKDREFRRFLRPSCPLGASDRAFARVDRRHGVGRAHASWVARGSLDLRSRRLPRIHPSVDR